MQRLIVDLPNKSYPILIGPGLLENIALHLCEALPHTTRVMILTDHQVAEHYLKPLQKQLQEANITTESFTIPAGEGSKSFAEFQRLSEAMLATKPDRYTPILALGGGVVGDLAGFLASTLLRGLPFIQLPTTLLAQVDSSVGGKTAINTEQGKNLVGSFYQPSLVIADTDTFATLPERERRAGYAEVVKYALIQDAPFLKWLEGHGTALIEGDQKALSHAIHQCCAHKAAIVTDDEKERGTRALLNLGHTFGHALERYFGYDGRLLHGEAVALGLVQAAYLSEIMSHFPPDETQRIIRHLQQVALPTRMQDLPEMPPVENLVHAMYGDKKQEAGRLTFILMHAIGEGYIAKDVPEEKILRALKQSCEAPHV